MGSRTSKEKVVILVADDIQAINYEVLRGLLPEEAKKAARRLGDNFVNMAERIVRSLPQSEQGNVSVARWRDVLSERFSRMQNILRVEYKVNTQFKTAIHEVVKTTLKDKAPDSQAAVNRLGDYIIEEFPLMFEGIDVGDVHYDLFLYPGLSALDVLESDIQNRRKFPEIADKLGLTEKQPIVEAYVE